MEAGSFWGHKLSRKGTHGIIKICTKPVFLGQVGHSACRLGRKYAAPFPPGGTVSKLGGGVGTCQHLCSWRSPPTGSEFLINRSPSHVP